MTETEELKNIIAAEAQEWANGFVEARVQYLSRRISKSGILEKSISSGLVQQARQEAVELLIAFEEHGRFIDMKPTAQDKWGRQAIERIKNWVRKVGTENFDRGWLRRYKRFPALESQYINKIAWGIAIRRSGGKYRRRRWWNKPKMAGITELFNEVASIIPEKVTEQVTKTLKNGNP